MTIFWYTLTTIHQGLSKHQEVGSTPVTKFTNIIMFFWGPYWYTKKVILKYCFHVFHMNYW